jgi:hypothetical protein
MLRATTVWVTLFALGCGGGGSDTDAGVVFIDSGPADAPVQACSMTLCGAECVDLSKDPNHCGSCDQACDSPGQICNGEVPCACPAAFIAATIDPSFGDQVTDQFMEGVHVGLAPILGSPIDLFLVGYTDETPVGTDLELTGALEAPFAGAGYDVDIQSRTVHTSYQVISGTLHLDTACAAGASGTLSNAVFAETTQAVPPEVVEGGCQFTVDSTEFTIGVASCQPAVDAGPP